MASGESELSGRASAPLGWSELLVGVEKTRWRLALERLGGVPRFGRTGFSVVMRASEALDRSRPSALLEGFRLFPVGEKQS